MKIYSAEYVLPISSEPISDGAVAVESGRIAAVGKAEELKSKYKNAEKEDFRNSILMPGLVNCHSHLELSILRGFLDQFDDDFASWLTTLTKTRAEKLSDDQILLSALHGAIEGVRAGVTCFGDIGRFGRAGFEALKALGLRGVLFQETEFSPDSAAADENFSILLSKFEELRGRETKRVQVGLSPHAPYTVSEKLFRSISEFSVKKEIPITIHTAESQHEEELMLEDKGFFSDIYKKAEVNWRSPGKSTVSYFNEIGVLEAKPLLAHCVRVSDEEIELIKNSGSGIAHCPKSNAKFGHGIAPLRKFLESGVCVGLGSDSLASNNTCDLFEEARFASLVSRTCDGGSKFLNSETWLETITLGGAKALGLEKEIGTLEIEKQADIIAVSLNDAARQPVYDPFNALVFSASAGNVVLSVVAGKEIYRDEMVQTVDECEVRDEIARVAATLV